MSPQMLITMLPMSVYLFNYIFTAWLWSLHQWLHWIDVTFCHQSLLVLSFLLQWFIYPLLVFVWIDHVIKLVICKFVMTQRLSSSLLFHHRCSLMSSLLLHSCFIYICCSSTGTLYSANLFVAFDNYRRILIRSSRTVSSALFRKNTLRSR